MQVVLRGVPEYTKVRPFKPSLLVVKDSARPKSNEKTFLHSITGTHRANSQDRSVDMYRYTNEGKARAGKCPATVVTPRRSRAV